MKAEGLPAFVLPSTSDGSLIWLSPFFTSAQKLLNVFSNSSLDCLVTDFTPASIGEGENGAKKRTRSSRLTPSLTGASFHPLGRLRAKPYFSDLYVQVAGVLSPPAIGTSAMYRASSNMGAAL